MPPDEGKNKLISRRNSAYFTEVDRRNRGRYVDSTDSFLMDFPGLQVVAREETDGRGGRARRRRRRGQRGCSLSLPPSEIY